MTKHYEQRKNSNKRYVEKFDFIKIRLAKGDRERYKEIAEAKGKSLNQFIVDCIEEKVKET